ncbi:hypothetical protein BGZ74_007220, partial [Mortierella antarctica]
MTSSSTFIAFLGATGGCTNAALVHTLNAGFYATALARTPSKLIDMLIAQGVSQSIIDNQLTIVKGDIADILTIKFALFSTKTHTIASQIISGICATTTKNIIQALTEIYAEHPDSASHKPSILVIPTTGVSNVKEDVLFGFQTFYHVALADPHNDKKEMERLLDENSSRPDSVFRGAISIHPSLLKGDHSVKTGKGWQKVKVGQETKPAVGYTIFRADVGEWIFEKTIREDNRCWFNQK